MRAENPLLPELLESQARVATRVQLADAGVSRERVRAGLASGRWQGLGRAVVLHSGPLTTAQRWWAAVLTGGDQAALAAWTALEAHGLAGWERETVHIVVPDHYRGRGRTPQRALDWVRVHQSRRFELARDRHVSRRPPTVGVERAAIDAAAWSRQVRTACAVLAAVVQQRLTTPQRLQAELSRAGRLRHVQAMRLALWDIAGGSQALSEIDFIRLCRRHGLPEPVRQVRRQDAGGRWRYLDVEWTLPDGRALRVEIDGGIHLEVRHARADMRRQNALASPTAVQLRFSAEDVRYDEAAVAAELARFLPPSASATCRSGLAEKPAS